MECSFTKLSPLEVETNVVEDQLATRPWVLHVDRAFNMNRSGVGLILNSFGGGTFEYIIRLELPSFNNIA